jgi:selenocysteine lyase/cysteine desulfurase
MVAREDSDVVTLWHVQSFSSTLPGLESILSPRTKIVAITHVSNVLGEIVDVQGAVALARKIAGPRY